MYTTLPDQTKIYYNVNGQETCIQANKPAIIFLHGGPGLADHSLYVPFWGKLQDVVQIVFIDMRGHGKSDGHEDYQHWNLAQWGQDIVAFCEVTGITKPIVAGVSFGSWVALAYATKFPQHPGAVILCHTEAKVNIEKRKTTYARKALKRGMDGHEISAIVQRLKDYPGDDEASRLYIEKCLPLYSTHPYTKEELAACKQNLKIWHAFEHQQYEFNFFPVLSNIIAPVLVIAGEEDPEHPPECAKELFEGLINSHNPKLVIIPSAGSPAYREKEEETLNVLKNYILKYIHQIAGL